MSPDRGTGARAGRRVRVGTASSAARFRVEGKRKGGRKENCPSLFQRVVLATWLLVPYFAGVDGAPTTRTAAALSASGAVGAEESPANGRSNRFELPSPLPTYLPIFPDDGTRPHPAAVGRGGSRHRGVTGTASTAAAGSGSSGQTAATRTHRVRSRRDGSTKATPTTAGTPNEYTNGGGNTVNVGNVGDTGGRRNAGSGDGEAEASGENLPFAFAFASVATAEDADSGSGEIHSAENPTEVANKLTATMISLIPVFLFFVVRTRTLVPSHTNNYCIYIPLLCVLRSSLFPRGNLSSRHHCHWIRRFGEIGGCDGPDTRRVGIY